MQQEHIFGMKQWRKEPGSVSDGIETRCPGSVTALGRHCDIKWKNKPEQAGRQCSAIDRQMLKNLSHGAGPALFLWVYKESWGWPKAAGANVSRSPGQMHPVFDTEPQKLCVLRQTTADLVEMRLDSCSTLEIQLLVHDSTGKHIKRT